MSFSTTYWAVVNTADGTVTGTGATDADNPTVPKGATVISADSHATIVAAEADGLQCKLISGVVRLMLAPVPASTNLDQIKTSAYGFIDEEAERAREQYLTPGSGQSLEYQKTADDAQRLYDLLHPPAVPVTGTVYAATKPPRSGTAQPDQAPPAPVPVAAAPVVDPADYPWLLAEQQALATIGVVVSLEMVAEAVLATMASWNTAGSAIKRIRREAKLKVSVATTSDAISVVLGGLSWPQPRNSGGPG